jgi:hypothetical protein
MRDPRHSNAVATTTIDRAGTRSPAGAYQMAAARKSQVSAPITACVPKPPPAESQARAMGQ